MKIEMEMQGFKELDSYLSSLARKDEKINKATVKAGARFLRRKLTRMLPVPILGGVILTLMKIS
ncbi:hypothetical protein P9D21_23030 [Bacillus licheniformis]|nr:hypothetical protein [Bacillus licheniformis]MDE1421503.1 hypothetical protein [Bacillus licheniformis]MEC5227379.1 hypothetical protein [Bacillus licheniformis]